MSVYLQKLASRIKIPFQSFLLSTPTLAWLLGLVFIPLVFTVIISFASRDVYGRIVYQWTTANYSRLSDPLYAGILWRSFWLGMVTTILCLLTGYPLAYYIARSPKKNKGWLLGLVIAPYWVNLLIRAYAWILILRNSGVINTILIKTGFITQPIQLLYTNGAVLLGLVYIFLPFMVLPLFATIDKMDWSLLDAANDLGAGDVRAFFHITLPITLPGIVAGSILVFIPAFGSFIIPALLGGDKTMMIGNLIENQFKSGRNWPFGSAAAVVLIILALIMVMAYSRGTSKTGGEEGIVIRG